MNPLDVQVIKSALYNAMDGYVRAIKFGEKEPSIEMNREILHAQQILNIEFERLEDFLLSVIVPNQQEGKEMKNKPGYKGVRVQLPEIEYQKIKAKCIPPCDEAAVLYIQGLIDHIVNPPKQAVKK